MGLIARRALALRCPRCGEGRLFDGWVRMRARCPACGLAFEREAGYFVGAIYVNYGLTVGLALGGYFTLQAWLDLTTGQQLLVWGTFAVVFPVWAYRYSKALWLGLDQLVDPVPGGRER